MLRHLYNICCVVREGERGIEISRLDAPMGPAWFSESGLRDAQLPIAHRRVGVEPDPRSGATQNALARRRSHFPPATVLDEISGDCASSTSPSARRQSWESSPLIRYQSIGRCPVTASTNYLSQLSAWLERGDGETQPVDLFPSYGLLVGAIVPEGEATLVIAAVAPKAMVALAALPDRARAVCLRLCARP